MEEIKSIKNSLIIIIINIIIVFFAVILGDLSLLYVKIPILIVILNSLFLSLNIWDKVSKK